MTKQAGFDVQQARVVSWYLNQINMCRPMTKQAGFDVQAVGGVSWYLNHFGGGSADDLAAWAGFVCI